MPLGSPVPKVHAEECEEEEELVDPQQTLRVDQFVVSLLYYFDIILE